MSSYIDQNRLKTNATYSDLNRFFGQEGAPDLLFDKQAISQALFNIFQTLVGEAGPIFEPEFGSILPQLLQQPLDEITAFEIRAATIQAAQRWEPRIEVDSSQTSVIVDQVSPGYQVYLVYRIRQTGEVTSLTIRLG